jgi:HPt (histidine-containing phosphotransfer) domain-containing protein
MDGRIAAAEWLRPDAGAKQGADRIRIFAPAGLEDLIPGYLSNRQGELISLADSVSKGDWAKVRSIGHGLKGSAAGYGFPDLAGIGRNLEEAAEAESETEARLVIDNLRQYLSLVEVVYG